MDENRTCETCKYENPYGDVTMADDHCGGCCSWNDKWEPKPGKIDGWHVVDKNGNVLGTFYNGEFTPAE